MLSKKLLQDELKRLPKYIDIRYKNYKRNQDISELYEILDIANQITTLEFVLNSKDSDWK